MGLRESWNGLGTGEKILVGVGIAGVVLIVGLVLLVVIATVLASFVLGLGDSTPDTPQAEFDFNHESETMATQIVHTGGETIEPDRLTVAIDGREMAWIDVGKASNDSVGLRDAAVVDVEPGDRIEVRWTSEDGERFTLATTDTPA